MNVWPIKILTNEWVRHRRKSGVITRATAANNAGHLSYFVAAHGPGPVKVDRAMIARWLEHTGKLKPSSRATAASAVRLFLRWAAEEGEVDHSAANLVPKVRLPKSVPRALNRAQVVKLLRHVADDERMSLLVAIMLFMGLRCVEVSRLDIDHIDEYDRTMRIRGKFDSERVLPIPPELDPYLERWFTKRTRLPGPLFPSNLNRDGFRRRLTSDTISGRVSKAMDAAGIKSGRRDGCSAHALRHTCASDVLDQGCKLTIVQALLGHTNLTTTSIYLRIANLDELRTAMAGRNYDDDPPPAVQTAPGDVGAADEQPGPVARVRHLRSVG